MYQQPPTLHHQMHPDQQDVVNDVKSQFNWSFESDFPFPLSGVIDVSDYSVDEPTKVNPVVEQNPILKKRKLEFDVIGTNSEKQSVECDSSLVKPPKAKTNTCNGDLKRKMDEKRDYIHVRARRGEATDSHSLAERARREKIKKKMQCLQDLVPGCNKTANKAEILDEIITYVQCLQSDVEFLTMKLVASTPTSVEFNMDNSLPAEQPVQLPGWQ